MRHSRSIYWLPLVVAMLIPGCAALNGQKASLSPEQASALRDSVQAAVTDGVNAGLTQIKTSDQTGQEFVQAKSDANSKAKESAGNAIETVGQVAAASVSATGVGVIAAPFILAGASILSMFIKRKKQ